MSRIHSCGFTPEEAVSNYQKGILLYYLISALGWPVGVFIFIVGYPHWISSVFGLMLPLACIWGIVYTRGLIAFYAKRDYYTFQPAFYRLIIFYCLVVTLRLALDYNLYPGSMVWPIAFCMALILYFILNRTAFYRASLKVSESMQWTIMALCVVYGYWLTIMINCHLDSSSPEQQMVEVSSKEFTSGFLPAPVLKLEFWNRGNRPSAYILTTFPLYQSVSVGDQVVIGVRSGLLGIPWYRSTYNIFNEGELEIGVRLQRE